MFLGIRVARLGVCVATAQKVGCRRSVFCTAEGKTAILPGMETPEALQQCGRREQPMIARLCLAMTRLADAERERIWAIVAAKEARLSIRQIARATGVSPTRMHQLLQADEARAIPVWLSQLQDQRLAPAVQPEGVPPAPSSPGWSHAESLCTQLNALTRLSAPLLRRPRYAAKHNPRPAASTVCALRRI